MANEDIREVVKARYGQAVKAVVKGAKPSCCGAAASHELSALDGAVMSAFIRVRKPAAA